MAKIATEPAAEVYRVVKSMLSSSCRNMDEFCSAINRCSENRSQRYVLSSADSVFDGLELPQNLKAETEASNSFVLESLLKVPKAVYMPKLHNHSNTCSGHLGKILDEYFATFPKKKILLKEYPNILSQLKSTAEFVAENSLDGSFGSLRASALDALDKYKRLLLEDSSLSDLKKLTLLTQLFDVMKLHSIDSEDLANAINAIIAKSPVILTQCSIEVLDCLSKFKLPPAQRVSFEKHLQAVTLGGNNIEQWSKLFMIVARSSDNRGVLECFTYSFKHVLRNSFKTRSVEKGHLPCDILNNIVCAISTLQRRLSSNDNIIKSATLVLESIWPAIEHNISKFQCDDLILVADCYFDAHRGVQHQLKHGMKNCLDVLMKELEKRGDEYLLKDWISILACLDKISSLVVVNVLVPKSENYYLKVSCIQRAWTENLAESLKSLETTDLANCIYSLSFPQCSNLCKYLAVAGVYSNPLDSVIEHRALSYVGASSHSGARNIFDFYTAQFQLLLPEKNGLRIALESKKNLRRLLSNMSTNRLLQLVPLTKFSELEDAKLLLRTLSDRILSNLTPLDISQSLSLLEYGRLFNCVALCDAVVASNAPRMMETRSGFCQLLELSKPLLEMPKSEANDYSPSSTLDQVLVNYAQPHVPHLSLSQLELVLRNVDKSGNFPKPLISAILSHAMDVDLQLVSQKNILDMANALGKLGIRHEGLLKRLENWALGNVNDKDSESVTRVIICFGNVLAKLGIKSMDLVEFCNGLLKGSVGKYDHDALDFETRVSLLHAMSLHLDASEGLISKFESLTNDAEALYGSEGQQQPSISASVHIQMYQTYINLLINGLQEASHSDVTKDAQDWKSKFTRLQLPCHCWFKLQERKCANFKNSAAYVSMRDALVQVRLGEAEPKVTEVYFVHFALESSSHGGEGQASEFPRENTAILLIPNRHLLKWWTPATESRNSDSILAKHHKVICGTSALVIDHLKKSGWRVVPIYTCEYEPLTPEARVEYIKKALTLNV